MASVQSIAQFFHWRKWILPVLIGTGAACALFWLGLNQDVLDPATGAQTTSWELLQTFTWSRRATWALLGMFGCIFLRDLGYIIRLRILSMHVFGWRRAFENIMLWELASALTPSVVGGSAGAVLILKRDGMTLGQSTATVLITVLLDEAFYLIAVPAFFLWGMWYGHAFFPSSEWLSGSIPLLFFIAYSLIVLFTFIILWGIVLSPHRTYRGLQKIASIRLISRWEKPIRSWSEDLLLASQSIRSKRWRFWLGAMSVTTMSWTARFLTLNMVLLVFFESVPHAAIVSRQLVLWLIMTFSPTPGSSGLAEFALPAMIGDILGLAYLAIVAVIWRLATYFLYLVLGAIVLPHWLVRTQSSQNKLPKEQGA